MTRLPALTPSPSPDPIPNQVPFTACDADSLPVNHQLPRPGARDVAGDDRAFTVRASCFNPSPSPSPSPSSHPHPKPSLDLNPSLNPSLEPNPGPSPNPNPNQARVSSYPAIVPESYKPLSETHEVIYLAAGRYNLLAELGSGLGRYDTIAREA